jgi:hypothetical protein
MPRRQLRLAAIEAAMQDKARRGLLRQLPVGHHCAKAPADARRPASSGTRSSMRAMTSATRRILLI